MSNRSPSNRPVPVACRSRAWGDQLWGTRHRATPVALRSSSSRSLEITGSRDRVWAANRVIARSPGVLPQLSMRRGGLAATQTGRRNPAFSLFPLRISRCARRLYCRARIPINPGPMAFLGRCAFAVQHYAFAGAKEFRKRAEERGQQMVPCQISSGISMRQLREYCRSRKAMQCTESSHGQRRWCRSPHWRSQCTGIISHQIMNTRAVRPHRVRQPQRAPPLALLIPSTGGSWRGRSPGPASNGSGSCGTGSA